MNQKHSQLEEPSTQKIKVKAFSLKQLKKDNFKYCQKLTNMSQNHPSIQFINQMQKQNLNQQPPSYPKRKCIAYKPNDFFQSFDKSQHDIISNYEKSAESLMIKSLAILVENIRKAAKIQITEPQSPKKSKNIDSQVLMSLKKNAPTFKKQPPESIFQEDESTNPQKEIQEMIHFQKTGKKMDKSLKKLEYCMEEKQTKSNHLHNKKHQKLMDSLKKLSISEEASQLQNQLENIPLNGNRGMTQDTNLLQFDEDMIKGKSINDLISQSNAKINNVEKKHFSPIESEDSEYEITDYSSNESSNEDRDYSERFAFDTDEQPMFGTIFSQGGKNFFGANGQGTTPNFSNGSTTSITNPPQKLNFKPLLDSPKKSKTKKKRLFVNKKKVPRWAEDFKQLAVHYGSEHQKKLRSQFRDIFGVCIVEDMKTNVVFNRNDTYTRSSTVKWEQGKYVV